MVKSVGIPSDRTLILNETLVDDRIDMNSRISPVVLLVDDDPLVLEALNELFCDEFSTVTARSGEHAVQLLDEQTATAAVVLDIRMAGMGGIETYLRMTKIRPSLPVIILTGEIQEMVPRLAELPVRPYAMIGKGEPYGELLRTVRAAIRGQAPKG